MDLAHAPFAKLTTMPEDWFHDVYAVYTCPKDCLTASWPTVFVNPIAYLFFFNACGFNHISDTESYMPTVPSTPFIARGKVTRSVVGSLVITLEVDKLGFSRSSS
jgi:hypothetical protein